MIYLFILVLLFYYTYYFDYLGRRKQRDVAYLFVLVIFILLAGFRYRLGVDTIRYESNFANIPTLTELGKVDFSEENYDPFYYILSIFAKTISSDFWVMQMLQASLVNVVIFSFWIDKNLVNVKDIISNTINPKKKTILEITSNPKNLVNSPSIGEDIKTISIKIQ